MTDSNNDVSSTSSSEKLSKCSLNLIDDSALSQMSGSYHEIFDSNIHEDMSSSSKAEARAPECYFNSPNQGLLLDCVDTSEATQYLTSKLVEDSLKYRNGNTSDSPLHQKPRTLSQLDSTALLDMERHAYHLASSIDSLIENLSDILQETSELTVGSIELYRDAVCRTCDEADTNIKSMYQLMAKIEELNKAMAPAYRLSDQIKEIKKLLDMFEGVYSVR